MSLRDLREVALRVDFDVFAILVGAFVVSIIVWSTVSTCRALWRRVP